MPVLFWSGGIDSTALLFDLTLHPHRYGHTEDEPFEVISLSADPKKKSKVLEPIMKNLHERYVDMRRSEKAALRPVLNYVEDPLFHRKGVRPARGGAQTYPSGLYGHMPDVYQAPFTPMWIMWQAAVGANWLLEKDPVTQENDWRKRYVYFGHQQDRPWWHMYDRDNLPYKCDFSPEYIENVNVLLDDEHCAARAPFMDNRLSKYETLQLAVDLGVPLEHTVSCAGSMGGSVECGICGPCTRVAALFRELGLPPKTYVRVPR